LLNGAIIGLPFFIKRNAFFLRHSLLLVFTKKYKLTDPSSVPILGL
jgi:hypothetical protein